MKNIHVLPANKPSRLGKTYNDVNKENFTLKLDLKVNDSFKEYINVLITSAQEIKDGDFALQFFYGTVSVVKCEVQNTLVINNKTKDLYAEKIILTTDQDLIDDGVQAIDDEFLEWFVKNPSCESVEVKPLLSNNGRALFGYKIIIPSEEHFKKEFLKQKRMSGAKTVTKILEESKQDNTESHYLSELNPFNRNNFIFKKYSQPTKETAEKNYNKPTEYAFLIFPLLAILDGNLMIGWLKKTYILRFKNKLQ